MSPNTLVCRQADPNLSAARTPVHLSAGCGAFHRRSPTGGAAKGTSLNIRTLPSALIVPCSFPVETVTWSVAALDTVDTAQMSMIAAANWPARTKDCICSPWTREDQALVLVRNVWPA